MRKVLGLLDGKMDRYVKEIGKGEIWERYEEQRVRKLLVIHEWFLERVSEKDEIFGMNK